ncbi:MAG TPA: cyclic nucleotide-binding domain-containing protein [Thermoanaerobaculia bacterium]|nr:cyclic nucleotide-binding domain-containing protein [Thermoanaerobaculia bacterium]
MVFKKLFGDGGREPGAAELSVEDLIVLERYDEAEAKLKARLKASPHDRHARQKLAEVYTAGRRHDDAVEEYVAVATEFSQEGFYDRALALLAKAHKLRPLDESLRLKIEALERAKRLDHSRVAVLEGLRAGSGDDMARQSAVMELQQIWRQLVGASLISRLGNDQLRRIFGVLQLVRVASGVVLAERGSQLQQLALIGRGLVEAVLLRSDGKATVLRSFGSGDIIGDGALFERRPWPATYRVAESATLLTLDRAGLEQVLMGNPDPHGLLVALREQRTDRDVAMAVQRLGEPG